jgi:hypothetical protein
VDYLVPLVALLGLVASLWLTYLFARRGSMVVSTRDRALLLAAPPALALVTYALSRLLGPPFTKLWIDAVVASTLYAPVGAFLLAEWLGRRSRQKTQAQEAR